MCDYLPWYAWLSIVVAVVASGAWGVRYARLRYAKWLRSLPEKLWDVPFREEYQYSLSFFGVGDGESQKQRNKYLREMVYKLDQRVAQLEQKRSKKK